MCDRNYASTPRKESHVYAGGIEPGIQRVYMVIHA